MGNFPFDSIPELMNLFFITFVSMKDKPLQTTTVQQSLTKEELETLKGFFSLLYRIDCRLKTETKKDQENENHQIRNQSDQT
jgi:hypothetical protein